MDRGREVERSGGSVPEGEAEPHSLINYPTDTWFTVAIQYLSDK